MRRKSIPHNRQKSTDVNSRRNPGKLSKATNERGLPLSPAPLAFQVNVPKGLKEILINSRQQIKEKEVVLRIPKELKGLKDPKNEHKEPKNENITPRPHVRMILEEFQEHFLQDEKLSLNESVKDEQLVPVITRGLLVYFEKTLATNLLYLEERGQYAFLDNKYRSGTNAKIDTDAEEEQTVCNWYGADHLLRLLVTLPEILSRSSVDEYSIDIIAKYVQDLLDWMENNKEELFLPSSEYVAIPSYYKTDIRRRNHGGGGK